VKAGKVGGGSVSKVFVSYRRDDSRLMCDRIYECLQQAFGRQNVFRDIDNIPGGVVWPDYINAAFAKCKVALVLMGPTWLTIAHDSGRRLDNPDDRVRIEIETALNRTIPIIPVLLQDAKMPATEQLPESLQKLTSFNARCVRPDLIRSPRLVLAHVREGVEL
jgi:TIR domain-containing protein